MGFWNQFNWAEAAFVLQINLRWHCHADPVIFPEFPLKCNFHCIFIMISIMAVWMLLRASASVFGECSVACEPLWHDHHLKQKTLNCLFRNPCLLYWNQPQRMCFPRHHLRIYLGLIHQRINTFLDHPWAFLLRCPFPEFSPKTETACVLARK